MANGNPFLDLLAGISNVGVQTLDAAGNLIDRYSSFKEKYNSISNGNTTTPPQQTTPAFQVTDIQDWLSNPENVQKLFLYTGLGLLTAFGIVYAVKKL